MKKWIKRIGISLLALLIVLFVGVIWIIKEAFGPKHKNLSIQIDPENSLICKETYAADMAAVFYDVDFFLKKQKQQDIKPGNSDIFH